MRKLTPYINPRVQEAQYAVRGLIPTRATEIQAEIQKGIKYPFSKMIFSNIGNPQALQQKPLTFPRQVMALVDCPTMLDDPAIVGRLPPDVVSRAKEMLRYIGDQTGAYTNSQGYDFVRGNVADFITKRDKTPVAAIPANIFLTDGASTGVKLVLQTLVGEGDAVMIPIPQYPLYTATISLLGGLPCMYYLDEAKGWSMTVEDLQRAYSASVAAGSTPRVMVVINPGNPTGQVISRAVMEGVVRFVHEKNMVLMADEVYQDNIYCRDKKFVSFREVTLSLGAPFSTEAMVVSMHSTSKGILGECGRRGGYTELLNFPELVKGEIVKLASINLCSNVNGQIMTDLMVKPPKAGDASFASYNKEYTEIFASLCARAEHLVKELSAIRGITCNAIEGAMYAFPAVTLPLGFLKHNDELNAKAGTKIAPDARWSLELLESTGVVVVPGSGFGQKDGTFHFRTTILPPAEDMQYLTSSIRNLQEKIFAKYGSA